jgi:hypothetical protein
MTATAHGWWPGQIRRGDPARAGLHDFFLIDGQTGLDVAGFASEAAALAYATRHRLGPGQVTVLQVAHPDGCDCAEAPPVTSAGRRRR